ncbi:MAG: DNA polymerase III subunit alpha [Myxococcota bacterium]|nr:DNA polymerase III subunit alpha [Myxococcota bacterium]
MIPLTLRSYYSLMWGVCSPQDICHAAKQLGYQRIALTDTDNLYGLWSFLTACRRSGIAPIIGAELTDKTTCQRAICLVETPTGYANLCRLITRRHCDTDFDLATTLPTYAPGLIVLTQSLDLLQRWHGAGVTVAGALPRRPDNAGSRRRRFCQDLGIPAVATPGSFFLKPGDAAIHRLLRAIDLNTSLSRLTPADTAPADAWLAGPDEYAQRFAVWPDALEASEALAARITFTQPTFGLVMPPWTAPGSRSADQVLREKAYQGARHRYGPDLSKNAVERLERELGIIAQKKFSAYFLVVQAIVRRSPRICGRGSGAASLVAYCLGITNVCPLKHNLYFERFLNLNRPDPPDIDVDFAWDERDAVLDAVLEQYKGRAAMVCNHVAFQPRMAIREAAKVYGLTDREIGQVTKRLPWFWNSQDSEGNFLDQLRNMPELAQLDFPEPWPHVIQLARRIIGIPRYLSVHAGGVVITPEPIDTYVPIEFAPKGVPIIQWEKDATEDSGLVKIDLLGNRSLAVIRDTIANLRNNRIPFREQDWDPEDDPATQANIAQGRTMGCFYIESPATRQLQQKAKCGDFEHVVIHSSIIRPAANMFIREYVRRLHGGKWAPIHPLLTDVLHETYGIMVYQEDVSKTAVAVAGFSHADADGLRKIMSKKDKYLALRDYGVRFRAGARARGLTDEQIDSIWAMIMSFSGYSFCKPHSASYARVSFQSAYLKTHHPAEFMAAVISNQGGFYSTFAYVSEARRMGVTILWPDVNQSDIHWKAQDKAIRVGLMSVKHLSSGTRDRMIERRTHRPYQNITDCLERVQPEEPEARALIHCGAFDALHPNQSRAALLWELAVWQKTHARHAQATRLFPSNRRVSGPAFPMESNHQRLRQVFAILGFLCDRHPMGLYADVLKKLGIVKAKDLHRHTSRQVRICGLLITGKIVSTKHGEPMEFITFEDETGLIETTFFPETYRRFCAMLDRTRPFILTGLVEEDFGALTVTVSMVEPLVSI